MEEEDDHTDAHDGIEQLRDARSTFGPRSSHISASSNFEDHGTASMGAASREPRLGFFSHMPNAGSASSSEAHGAFNDYSRQPDSVYLPRYTGPSNSNMMLNPKRAYRQRRKDPSCDACRERKVKCDATDTTSCTECSSRNVRCQFTKDTNRRMSSIKQVQDLEKQLQDVRLQLERYRTSEPYTEQSSPSGSSAFDSLPEVADISRSPRRMLKPKPQYDFSTTRARLTDVGRGLLKPLIAPLITPLITPLIKNNPEHIPFSVPSLPPQETVQQCLNAYFECLHRRLPIFYWAEFCSNLWTLYSWTRDQVISDEMISLSFAVLALGAFFSTDTGLKSAAEHFVTTAISRLGLLNKNMNMTHALAGFLISIYFLENNRKSVSWFWLGTAIQVAQDNGLHISGGQWSRTDGEIRRRIWYCFYVSERFLAIEIGRPMLINDDDCDAEYPETLKEEEAMTDIFHPQRPTILKANVYIARLLQPLAHLCRSLCIPPDMIRTYGMHLGACLQLFPPELQLGAKMPLDPLVMTPLLLFQNTRLSLHRHNLSPACSVEQRSVAIKSCATAAADTAVILSRCFEVQATTEQVEDRLRLAATTLSCTHVWRCLLFLSYCQFWGPFHVLLRFASIVGDLRPVNVSCGRYLSYFLDRLIEVHKLDARSRLEEDAALIVLLSGDVQGGPNSWIWNAKELSSPLSSRHGATGRHVESTTSTEQQQKPEWQHIWERPLTEEEKSSWGGWDKVLRAAQYLEHLQQPQQAVPVISTINTTMPGGSDHGLGPRRTESDRKMNASKSRMAIASITDQTTS